MTDINDRLEAAAVKAEDASEIMRRFKDEPEGVYIDTESGPLPTLKTWMQDLEVGVAGLPARVDDLEDFEIALADSTDPSKGSGILGLSIQDVPGGVYSRAGDMLSTLHRAGKTGLFTTADDVPGLRFGPLAYRKMAGGEARLATCLSRFLPAGAHADPTPPQRVYAQVAIPSLSATGTADIYRYVNTSIDFWGVAGGELLQATVIDLATGRRYADTRSYPGTDYSATVLNSSGFGGLTVEIKQAAGVPAPTTLVVELGYLPATTLKAIYVDPVNGLDTFDGRSWDWAMKTIPAAMAKTPDALFIRPAVYDMGNYPGAYTGAGDIAIRCIGGRATFIPRPFSFSAWAVHSGTTYVTTIGGSPTPVGAIDMSNFDELGAPSILKLAATLADCISTPGTFFYDDAGPRKMYVHLSNNGVPTSDKVMPYSTAFLLRHSSATAKVYISDCDFISGSGGALSARDAGVTAVLINERCRLLGSYNTNGLDAKNIGMVISIDGLAAYNANDGFNYTEQTSLSPHFIEINCIGYRNYGDGTGNGSTSHNSVKGFRINCDYSWNTGPGVADVGDAVTLSVNLTSNYNGPDSNASGFRADGNAIMCLDGGSASGNGGPDIHTTNGATIKARDVYAKSQDATVQLL